VRQESRTVTTADGRMKHAVLVVEDGEDIRQLVVTVLRRAGRDVQQQSSGRECLKRVRQQAPDIVVLDLGLPDADGTVARGRSPMGVRGWLVKHPRFDAASFCVGRMSTMPKRIDPELKGARCASGQRPCR